MEPDVRMLSMALDRATYFTETGDWEVVNAKWGLEQFGSEENPYFAYVAKVILRNLEGNKRQVLTVNAEDNLDFWHYTKLRSGAVVRFLLLKMKPPQSVFTPHAGQFVHLVIVYNPEGET